MAKNKTATKSKAMTKSAVFQAIADKTGLTRKQVGSVFEELAKLIKTSLKKDKDAFTVPGLLKLRLRRRPAVKGGQVKPNPFKPGETIVTKDQPAKNVVKALPLKNLKDMVQ